MITAKIMLMSTIVLAAVGGALAFKAKVADKLFCIQPDATPINLQSTTDPEYCNELFEGGIFGSKLYYGTSAPDPDCHVTSCPAVFLGPE
jgi:hypothetical protein